MHRQHEGRRQAQQVEGALGDSLVWVTLCPPETGHGSNANALMQRA